jgi:hypothetical protein
MACNDRPRPDSNEVLARWTVRPGLDTASSGGQVRAVASTYVVESITFKDCVALYGGVWSARNTTFNVATGCDAVYSTMRWRKCSMKRAASTRVQTCAFGG